MSTTPTPTPNQTPVENQATPAPKRKLEDLPARYLPKELGPLYGSVLENLEQNLRLGRHVSVFQTEFCSLYTWCCLDKDTQLRIPLAAKTYVDLRSKKTRTPEEEDFLKKLIAAVKTMPKNTMDDFLALVKILVMPTQTPAPATTHELMPAPEPVEETAAAGARESSKEFILKMQHCLKGKGEHAVPNYDEATSEARIAIANYPKNPDVILQAAICFQTRAAREKGRHPDERIGDMEKALELLEEFLMVTLKPPYNHLDEYKTRREAVSTRWNEIRQKLHETKKSK